LEVHVSDVDYFIEVNYPIPKYPIPNQRKRPLDRKIYFRINHDGDCIQLGIGGIPNAVAKSLYGKKDLGVHTEMLTNEMAKLAKAGVITGKQTKLFQVRWSPPLRWEAAIYTTLSITIRPSCCWRGLR
jgi:acyl-CoA hydrolase